MADASSSSLTPARMKTRREQYDRLHASLEMERKSNFDAHWQDLSSFIFPRRTRFWTGDRNRGDKRNQNIIDSTARFAARTLQSGMHAGLTSPARPWMKLTTPDPELAEHGPVKEWLHITTQRIRTVMQQSNIYRALPTVYGDLGVFGTAAMSILEDTKDLFRAYTYPLGSYTIGVDARGNATTFTRAYQLTVRALVETFVKRAGMTGQGSLDWSRTSSIVKDLYDRGDYETAVDIIWVVKPNDQMQSGRLEAKYSMPWASCHFELNGPGPDKYFLRESGFRTFPIMAPRWEVGSAEDSYGVDCPGMTALGDVKQLQIMQRRGAQALNKMVDPPLTGPNALRSQKVSLLSGDITYLDQREGQQGLRSIHDVNLRLDHMAIAIEKVQYRIQRAFYEDLFLMLANSDQVTPITAEEVRERHEEKLLALGPVLESTNDELLDPMIDRIFSLMESAGLLPEPPQELQGVQLKVEYISILAQAQKLVGVVGQDRFLQSMLPLAEQFPKVRHKININRVVDNYADMLGVDPRIVRPDDEADQLEQAEAQAQQAAAEAEQLKNMGAGLKSAAQAPLDTDNALSRLTQNLGVQ